MRRGLVLSLAALCLALVPDIVRAQCYGVRAEAREGAREVRRERRELRRDLRRADNPYEARRAIREGTREIRREERERRRAMSREVLDCRPYGYRYRY